MTQSKYVFADNPEERERERLRQFEAWGDRYTIRRLESIGIPAGWRCLDVGAGSGSVATLLAHRVGPSGTVVAADIDLRFLTNLPPNVEVRRHDITTSDLESKSYDFVHFRALLMHLPDFGRRWRASWPRSAGRLGVRRRTRLGFLHGWAPDAAATDTSTIFRRRAAKATHTSGVPAGARRSRSRKPRGGCGCPHSWRR
jgi:SAM-dependent methyltransferase